MSNKIRSTLEAAFTTLASAGPDAIKIILTNLNWKSKSDAELKALFYGASLNGHFKTVLDTAYDNAVSEIGPLSGTKPDLEGKMKALQEAAQSLENGDFAGAFGKLTGVVGIEGTIAAVAGYFMGGGVKGALKWGGIAVAAGFGLEFLTGKGTDGKSPLSSLMGGLGSAGTGIASFFSEAGGNLTGAYGDKMKGIFDALKNPQTLLTTLAVVIGGGIGISKGKGLFDSMYTGGLYAAFGLIAMTLLPLLLGGGKGPEQSLVASNSADYGYGSTPPAQLANAGAPRLTSLGTNP